MNEFPPTIPVFSTLGVGINANTRLQLPKTATFKDIAEYFENEYHDFLEKNPALMFDDIPNGYLYGYYINELYDSGSFEFGEHFSKLLKGKSDTSVYEFFVENSMYFPDTKEGREDLAIFFHTEFV